MHDRVSGLNCNVECEVERALELIKLYAKNWENDRCKVCKSAYQIYIHEWIMESDVLKWLRL